MQKECNVTLFHNSCKKSLTMSTRVDSRDSYNTGNKNNCEKESLVSVYHLILSCNEF